MSANTQSIKGHEILQGVAAEALDNDDYRRRLIDDPKAVLREEGLEVDDGTDVVVHESSSTRVHLVLPPRPAGGQELDVNEVNIAHLDCGVHF